MSLDNIVKYLVLAYATGHISFLQKLRRSSLSIFCGDYTNTLPWFIILDGPVFDAET